MLGYLLYLLFLYFCLKQISPKLEQKIVNSTVSNKVIESCKTLDLMVNFIQGEPDKKAINWFVQ